LVGGKRVQKIHPRIEAYGTIDELNSFIACLLEEVELQEDRLFLRRIQSNLFIAGASLATEDEAKIGRLSEEEVRVLEIEIDKIDELIPPMKFFVLPGGTKANALAHVCRTICRRAERNMYRITEGEALDAITFQYINRLSDYFFLFARKQNFIHKIEEIKWENPCK
jgi:cob(I)alamin adenosyltransferase